MTLNSEENLANSSLIRDEPEVSTETEEERDVGENSCMRRIRRLFMAYNPDYATVTLLFCVNLLNYMDRFTIAGRHISDFPLQCC